MVSSSSPAMQTNASTRYTFCRECGHEYHPVRSVQQEGRSVFLARNIDDGPPTKLVDATRDAHESQPEGETFGFLTPHPSNDPEFTFADRAEDYPETWLEFGCQR